MSEKVRRKKYTYEEVYSIFENNGFKLLDKIYVDNKTKMTCRDSDGYKYSVSLDSLRPNRKYSKFCNGNPYTDENIDNFLLLDKSEYKRITCNITSTKQQIDLVDNEGFKYRLQVSPLLYSNRKLTRVGNGNYWSAHNINIYLRLLNSNDRLLTEKFTDQNTPLHWICEHGHMFHTNWNNYYTKGYRCKECANIARMYTLEQCKVMVLKRRGYKLIDMERRKNINKTDVIYYYIEHRCGHRYWVRKQEFDGGKGCKPCADKIRGVKRRDSEDLIRKKVEGGTDFEYRYIKYKFVGDSQGSRRRKIKVRHEECGKEYWVEYSAWNSGSRCGDCHPIERYAVPYEEWQDRIKNKNIHNLELLDVYYKVRNDTGRNEAWLKLRCKSCKDEIDRAGGAWKSGCPNCTISKGEDVVRKSLDKYNIRYTQQMKYDGLLGVGGGNLSYDFYLNEYNLLIEYQGEFHDGSDRMLDKSYLPTQQEHDRRKREYAEQQGIDLLEIWYWDFDNIEGILKEKLQLD